MNRPSHAGRSAQDVESAANTTHKAEQGPPPTLEALLQQIEEQAAFLCYAADSAAQNRQPPDARTLDGWADICAEIQKLALQARIRSLKRT